LTVLGSTIYNNVANGGSGGGIFYDAANFLFIDNSTVLNNTASSSGGGIYDSSTIFMTIQDSQVLSNTVNGPFGAGGGVWTNDGNFPKQILTSTVAFNRADGDGGGIWNQTTRGLQVFNSTVLSNTAGAFLANPGNGGGIWSAAFLQVINSQVLSNTALFAGTSVPTVPPGGGGIYQQGAPMTIGSSQVAHNRARALSGFLIAGGGIWNSGIATLNNTVVEHNRADGVPGFGFAFGGGIHNENRLNLLNNSQVRHNRADWFSAYGGGVSNENNSGGSATFTLNASSVSTNTAQGDPSNGFAFGGGVFIRGAGGSAIIVNSTLGANQASAGQASAGGGAYNAANMNIVASTVQSNTATSLGGGVYNDAAATGLFVNVSTLRSNSAPTGGGLYNAAAANMIFSALVNNTASTAGGGAHNATGGTLSSQNNTFSGNSASNGGGLNVEAGSSAYLTFTTVASTPVGSGIVVASGGTAEVYATLLAYNAGNNCVGTVTDNGFSMSSDTMCPTFAFTNTNPLLQPLALNGGQTLNHALSPGSPALDQVSTPCPLSVDQRSVSRPQGTGCDIGAFELEAADLEVSKSADPSPVIAGQTITYTVVVSNVSAFGSANNIVLTDTLLGGTTFGGVVSSGGFTLQSSSSTQAVFTLSSLAAGSSATLVFTATAPASGPITNTVTVASGNPDPVLSNNTASVSTPVIPAAYLAVSKAQSFVPHAPGVVLPGSTVTYTIVVTNTGPSAAPVAIQDTLASGVGFVAAGGSGWSCSYLAPTVTCNHPAPLSAGASASVMITVTAPITSSTVFTNAADGFAGAFPGGPFASNVVTLTTAANADLRLSKTATPSPVFAGQLVTYVVSVQNAGPDVANNVVITDVFQGGATFSGVIATSGGVTLQSSTSTAVTFTVSSLGVGSSAVMTYTVVAPASGVITNTATVTSDAVDPAPTNNVFSTTTPVTPVANLSISKAQSFITGITGTITPTAQLTYTILVTNNGPSSATSVTVTDNLPAGLIFVSATGSGWTCSFSALTVTCTRPTLTVGAAPAIQIVASAPITPGLVLTNTATVNSATHPNTPVTSNSVSVKVQFRAFLPIVRRP
jgi:uncharacterized repeat protein (TIGR01451 family)